MQIKLSFSDTLDDAAPKLATWANNMATHMTTVGEVRRCS